MDRTWPSGWSLTKTAQLISSYMAGRANAPTEVACERSCIRKFPRGFLRYKPFFQPLPKGYLDTTSTIKRAPAGYRVLLESILGGGAVDQWRPPPHGHDGCSIRRRFDLGSPFTHHTRKLSRRRDGRCRKRNPTFCGDS